MVKPFWKPVFRKRCKKGIESYKSIPSYIMKTIAVVYTDVRLADKDLDKKSVYYFLCEDSLAVGDLLKSPSYPSCMQVVGIWEGSDVIVYGHSLKLLKITNLPVVTANVCSEAPVDEFSNIEIPTSPEEINLKLL